MKYKNFLAGKRRTMISKYLTYFWKSSTSKEIVLISQNFSWVTSFVPLQNGTNWSNWGKQKYQVPTDQINYFLLDKTEFLPSSSGFSVFEKILFGDLLKNCTKEKKCMEKTDLIRKIWVREVTKTRSKKARVTIKKYYWDKILWNHCHRTEKCRGAKNQTLKK